MNKTVPVFKEVQVSQAISVGVINAIIEMSREYS